MSETVAEATPPVATAVVEVPVTPSFWSRLVAHLRQPTTITGVGTILGTLGAVLSGTMSWAVAAPIIGGACVLIIAPDNSGAKTTVQQILADVVNTKSTTVTPAPGSTTTIKG